MALRSFTISTTQLSQGQTATGTILLEGVVRSIANGSATVDIIPTPSTVVDIHSTRILITCCTTDGAGHSLQTFNIAALPVARDTQVIISASRPNQTPITRTITVRAGLATLSINDVRVTEPRDAASPVIANFTFTLSQANPPGASVAFRMSNQTAVRCQGKSCDGTGDYIVRGGVLDFGPTETTKTVSVPICHDTIDEADETFRIDLSNPVGLNAPDTVAIGTIFDND